MIIHLLLTFGTITTTVCGKSEFVAPCPIESGITFNHKNGIRQLDKQTNFLIEDWKSSQFLDGRTSEQEIGKFNCTMLHTVDEINLEPPLFGCLLCHERTFIVGWMHLSYALVSLAIETSKLLLVNIRNLLDTTRRREFPSCCPFMRNHSNTMRTFHIWAAKQVFTWAMFNLMPASWPAGQTFNQYLTSLLIESDTAVLERKLSSQTSSLTSTPNSTHASLFMPSSAWLKRKARWYCQPQLSLYNLKLSATLVGTKYLCSDSPRDSSLLRKGQILKCCHKFF